MPGKTITFKDIAAPDQLGCDISNLWVEWRTMRAPMIAEVEEVRKYLFATDTTQTTNSKLPWKNTTTLPKLTQIRDNLHSNYIQSLFPSTKKQWLKWYASEKDANSKEKRDAILNYMQWVVSQDRFRSEMSKLVLDYIDYGNAFGTVEWIDERNPITNPPAQVGYVGPAVRRISPLDIVFNPTAPTFIEAPKIIRSLVSIGEIKRILDSESTSEDAQAYQDLYDYIVNLRATVRQSAADLKTQDAFLQMDGFTSFRAYLDSNFVEILTFYGDIFDWGSKTLLANHKIMVVDRHKVISKKQNPSYFGFPPIFHVGWRQRQDNLWAMGPLANLVGLQYRVDHVENLKADVFDLLTFPPLKVKGYVQDFQWGPMEKIMLGDEGDVEILAPPFQILQANIEINNYLNLMEVMAGAPKEAMGFRSPGEKTAYEVQRLENAASRIFIQKVVQFEMFEERLLNAQLELSRRNLPAVLSFPIYDPDFNIQVFADLSPADITGAGQIKPMAARHFAEKAELVQNLTNFYTSALGQDQDIRRHLSSIQLAKLFEDMLDIQEWGIVQPNVRIFEMADAQRLQNSVQTDVLMEAQTPTGLTADDTSGGPAQGGPVGPVR